MATLSNVFVGVDVSKKHLDVYIHPIGKAIRIANSDKAIRKLCEELTSYTVEQIVCEATGGYEYPLRKALTKLGYKVWIVEPKRIKAFITFEGIKAKTDKIDAKMIALFASKKTSSYEAIERTDDDEKLKRLVALKASIIASRVEVKNQLQQNNEPVCIGYLNKIFKFYEKQIAKLTEQINTLIENNNELQNKAKILISIPGIGDSTTAMCFALLPELGKVTNKQAAALVGVAPYIKQSGAWKGQAHISGGRSLLRSAIYMAALTASRYNSVLKIFYERLIAAGKSFKVAIVAVMRKLVIYMNTLVRKGEVWNVAT